MIQKIWHPLALVPALLAVMLAIAACGSSSPQASYETVVPASISPGSDIPSPSEGVIITMKGDISAKNVGDTLQLDMPTLEELGLVKYTVNDPWLNATNTYTGVLMSDLIKYLGPSDSATQFRFTALDDYQVDIDFETVEKWPILLATRNNGNYMDIENSGPTRIIWPYDDYPEIDQVALKDSWIWNIKQVEVR